MATDAATISQMQQALLKYRAAKFDTSTPAPTPAATTTPDPSASPSAPVSSSDDGIGAALADYRKQRDTGTLPSTVKKDPSKLAEFAKSIFSAPATIVARPFQAAAEVGQYLGGGLNAVDPEAIDAATKKIPLIGGLIAPVDQNFGDVKKDIGRAAETVALGTGAPIAGGALFGAGASLEQGNDLFSAQTAVDAALGAGGGKVLDWIGKPLLNAAGKVVGKVTPKIVKDVASGGADAIAKFAATHDLPLGVSTITKPLSEGIQKGAQAIDEGISSGLSKGGAALRKTAAEQFPDLNPTKHYQDVNAKDIRQPTTVNKPAYAKATAVFNDAKARGIDLDQVANDRGIIHDQIAEGGAYNTKDTVDSLRENNYKMSDTLARPAIQAADPGVENVPVSQIRGAMLKKIHDIPATQIDPEERATMIKQITKRYAPGGAADLAHPNGYSLEDLHDARIVSAKNGGYKVGRSNADTTVANRSRSEGQVFAQIFDRNIPESAGLQPFRKELEKNFMLADYLESLHGKKVPEGITKKAVKLFGRAIGGTLGGKVGGFPGFLAGSQFGDILFGGFETLPNPIKMKVLQSIVRDDPAAFQTLRKYIKDEDLAKLLRKALPASGESSYAKVAPTLFATPKGAAASSLQEAVDLNSVATGAAKAPKIDTSPKAVAARTRLIDMVQQNGQGPYVPAHELPVINAGAKPRAPKVAPLTKEATAILDKLELGNGAPAFITNTLERIANENGITVTNKMTANDVIKALIQKRTDSKSLNDIL